MLLAAAHLVIHTHLSFLPSIESNFAAAVQFNVCIHEDALSIKVWPTSAGSNNAARKPTVLNHNHADGKLTRITTANPLEPSMEDHMLFLSLDQPLQRASCRRPHFTQYAALIVSDCGASVPCARLQSSR